MIISREGYRRRSSRDLAAGRVELRPASRSRATTSRYSLQGHAIRDRVLDDRAHDAGRDVGRSEVAIAEVSGQCIPLVITEIASAVESEPDGDLSLVRPSAVRPDRSSRKTVTTRRISSTAAGTCGSSRDEERSATRVVTMFTSSSSLSGSGITTC
jgi:hypothetical protein